MFIDAVGHLIERALTFVGMTPPAVSGAGQGRLFFNGTKFRVSENGGAYADLTGGIIPSGDWTVVFERRVTGGSGPDPGYVDTGITYDQKYDYAIGITYLNAGPTIGSSIFNFLISFQSGFNPLSYVSYLPDGATPTTLDNASLVFHKMQPSAIPAGTSVIMYTSTTLERIGMDNTGKWYTNYLSTYADDVYFVIARRQVLP
jgi:hypothetical protein